MPSRRRVSALRPLLVSRLSLPSQTRWKSDLAALQVPLQRISDFDTAMRVLASREPLPHEGSRFRRGIVFHRGIGESLNAPILRVVSIRRVRVARARG